MKALVNNVDWWWWWWWNDGVVIIIKICEWLGKADAAVNVSIQEGRGRGQSDYTDTPTEDNLECKTAKTVNRDEIN